MPQYAPNAYIHSPYVAPMAQSMDWTVLQGSSWTVTSGSGEYTITPPVVTDISGSDIYGDMIPRKSNIRLSATISSGSGSTLFGLSYSPLTSMGSSNFYWKVTSSSYTPYRDGAALASPFVRLDGMGLMITIDDSYIRYYDGINLRAVLTQSLSRPVYPHICVIDTGSTGVEFNHVQYMDINGTFATTGSPTAIHLLDPQVITDNILDGALPSGSANGGGWDIAWSPFPEGTGTFCTVGARTIATSTDGLSWTRHTNSSNNLWQGICWSNPIEGRQFVAVASSGPNNRAMTSPDGINWTLRPTPQNNNWVSVDYSHKLHRYVAVAAGGDKKVMTSYDGANWTLGNLTDISASYTSVCWGASAGAGTFCIVGKTALGAGPVMHRVLVSSNGTNWEGCGSPGGTSYSLRDVCWSPKLNMFCAIAEGNNSAVMLSNGISGSQKGRYVNMSGSWNVYPMSASSHLAGIAWSDELEMFCISTEVNLVSRTMYFSSDGIHWSYLFSGDVKDNWSGVAYSSIQHVFTSVNQVGSMSVIAPAPLTSISASATSVYVRPADLPHTEHQVWTPYPYPGHWYTVNDYVYPNQP